MHSDDAVKRVHRMWAEVTDDHLSVEAAQALGTGLLDEKVPPAGEAHKESVLAAVNMAVAARTRTATADRSFRLALDRGTTRMGTWRVFDTIRPQLALLPWTFWLLSSVIFVCGAFLLPLVGEIGPRALVVTVPLLGLVGLYFTLRASHYGVREWEQSCTVTPFQLALARIVLVLFVTLAASLVASVLLVRQDIGTSFAGLVISWFAPLLLITGLYLAADVAAGGMAGSAVAAVAWFGHVLVTKGGQVATTVAASEDGFALSLLDGIGLLLGSALLILGLVLSSHDVRESHEHSVS